MATYSYTKFTTDLDVTQNVVVGDTVTFRVFTNANDPTINVNAATNCSVSPSGGSSGTTFSVTGFTAGNNYTATFSDNNGNVISVTGSVTGTDSGTISINNVTEGQSFTVTVVASSIATSTWHYDIDRLTGTSEPEGINPSWLSFTPSIGTQTFSVATGQNSGSEVQYQGEQFIIYLKTGGTLGSGTVLDQQNVFYLYDDDPGITSVGNLSIASGDTTHTPSISYSFTGSGGVSYVEYRIVRTTGTATVVYSGTGVNGLANPSGTVTPTVNDVPPQGSSYTYRVDVYNGSVFLNGPSYTVTRAAAPLPTAPVISSVTDNNAAAASVTATVNLSSTGSNGTLYYIQTTTTSTPAINDAGWQTGNTFSHPRGTTRYYWAQRSNGTNRAISASVSKTVGYLSPDNSIADIASQTLAFGSTSFSITIANGGSTTVYQVRDDITTHESRTGNGTITVTDAPAAGGTKDYTIFAKLPTANGGNNTYTGTGEFFSITVAAQTGGGGGGTGDNTSSEDRVVLGKAVKASSTKYGLFISKEGTAVIDGSGNLTSETNLIFDSTSFKTGVVHKTVTSSGAWTTGIGGGYIPGILTSGVFPNPSYFDGQNADVAMVKYDAGPIFEITSTNITRRLTYQGGSSWLINGFSTGVTAAILRFPCQYGKMTDTTLFGFSGTTAPTSATTGVNRVCLGDHPNYGYGLFISRPGVNVLSLGTSTATDRDKLIFDSTQENYSQILKSVTSLSLTRATIANPSQYDQTITYDNTGEIPAISVALLSDDFTENEARVEIVSTSSTSVVLRLPYYKNNAGGSTTTLNPTSATIRVVVMKKG